MAIRFLEKDNLFVMDTENSSYQMKVDAYGYLLHLYYGRKTGGTMEYLLTYADRGFSGNPYEAGEDRTYSLDALPQEYPVQGTGDFRTPGLVVRDGNGAYSCDLRYGGHEIRRGKYGIPGLPAMYGDGDAAEGAALSGCGGAVHPIETLEIYLIDRESGLKVTLLYGVFPQYDMITRAVKLENGGERTLRLDKVYSACLDFLSGEWDLIQFYGRHAMERNVQRTPVSHGAQVIGSRRGTSSHQYNPFVILAERDATEESGGCYGLSLVYSGGFKAEAEKDQYDQTRVMLGLQDELFEYELEAGSTFYAPEAVLCYSGNGLGQLSRNYHKAFRNHLCRGKYKTAPRPVLLNNWEATYFDFTGEKIFEIAAQAAELGVEMLVLDDGWFGKRDSDTSGLGDWYVNEKKLGGSLSSLVERINGLGMKFGIWVEPEMVSEDSDLYREHPDWAFTIPGRKPVISRNQLVLDFSRKEVVDAVFDQISKVLDSANIEYVKWDMNRSITDVYTAVHAPHTESHGFGGCSQGAVLYRYMLGLYDFLERLNVRYPNLLIEGCSGGGGRFDAGMLYYTPQIWCSDNTDAIDRIRIQYGTSFGYPISAVGSHVSAVPNHQTGRITSIETRGVVAMAGSFGYELDLNRISEAEKACVKAQIQGYRQYWDLIHNGDYYRLTNPFAVPAPAVAAWLFVAENRSEALLNVVTLETHGNPVPAYVRLSGLEPGALYRDGRTGEVYPGAGLMDAGIPVPRMDGEYRAWQVHLVRVVAK